ncbi:hypothetical protein QVD17_37291 [Tagetes erecta]|uniref:Uncharacterized protein n=1 Tax=Tagetes erecta TaxID=13708 RepID=A0AAD8JUB4_TARER|nr:hypothetical protein QVD17_37291 [Tagetes erecta]
MVKLLFGVPKGLKFNSHRTVKQIDCVLDACKIKSNTTSIYWIFTTIIIYTNLGFTPFVPLSLPTSTITKLVLTHLHHLFFFNFLFIINLMFCCC